MHRFLVFVLLLSVALLAGCGGSGSSSNGITLRLTPSTAQTINQGETLTITAAVANDSSNRGVSWTLSPSSGSGTLTNMTSTSVTYSAPANVASNLTATVTATSVANTSVSVPLQITVQAGKPAISVTLSPSTPQTIGQGQTLGVTATVANDSSNQGVTWTISPSSGSGTLTSQTASSVTYNAPASVTENVVATLTAKSVANPSASASVQVTVQSSQPTEGLNVVIKNLNSVYNDSNVYFSFRVAPIQGTINGQPLVEGNVYSLADIGSGIQLQNFQSGRIYFSLGSPLPVSTNDPEPVNPTVDGYNVRFDKMEITYSLSNSSGVANLTTIDYFGIPLAIQTYTADSSTPQQALTFTVPGNTVINSLAQLTGNNSQVLLKTTNGSFLRVLGPTLAPAGSYPSFQSYINEVASGPQLQIQDLFSSKGSTPPTSTQCYDFTASFDNSGNLNLNGGGSSYNGGPSVGPNHQIVIQASNLAPGVYSANPPYTVDGAPADIANNDVYAAAVRDVLAAFGFGFMNSSTIDPNTNKAFNTEPSAYWWQSPKAFGFLQPSAPNYNQYANYLYSISAAYGQPFSDRWQTVQAKLDPSNIATMEIDILPDTGAVPVQPNNGPPNPKSLYCVQ